MKPKYSVIIPIYNAEHTLRRCVDSLLIQKRVDIEIILVNDGSPDGCADICEQYEKENKCIKYISKENGGVSTARNVGIEAASGDYLTFIDSDDYVAEDYFPAIDAMLEEYDYDLICFSNFVTDGKTFSEHICKPFIGKSREIILPKIIDAICNKTINGPVAKVYKREMIESFGLIFPVGAAIAEDRAFNIAYSTHINSYRVSNTPIYYVSIENENSLSRKKQTDLNKQFEITGKYARNSINSAAISDNEKRQYFAALNFGTCRSIYKTAKDMHRDNIPFFKRLKRIKKLCREINRQHYQYPKTRYCRLISLPVRWNLALVIDAMAWKLTH